MASTRGIWPKDWLRVLTQAMAIVASILVAFAIDAWWDERNDQRWQTEQLIALHDEFVANREELTWVVRMDNWIADSIEAMLAELRTMEPGSQVQIPELQIRALGAWRTSDIAMGALDALLASGRLGDIENADLRRALAEWPAEVEDVQEDEALARDFLPTVLVPTLLGQGLIDTAYKFSSPTEFRRQSEATGQTIEVTATQDLIEIAAVRIWNARLAGSSVERLIGRLDRTVKILETELDERGVSSAAPGHRDDGGI